MNFWVKDVEAGEILEVEGRDPTRIYIILQGQVGLYKRPESLYSKEGKLVNPEGIQNLLNPRTCGNLKIGL